MPGSPWMPMPISISFSPMVNWGFPTSGTMFGERATPMVRTLAAAFSAIRFTSASEALVSAMAPAHLYRKKIPATPRRLPSWPFGAEATSSAPTTCSTVMFSMDAMSFAMSKFMMSPP